MVEPITFSSIYSQSPLRRPRVQALLFPAGGNPDDPQDGPASQRDRSGLAKQMDPVIEVDSASRAHQADQVHVDGQTGQTSQSGHGLSGQERAEVERLKAKDSEIRSHGRARASETDGQTGSVVYTCRTGPDGNRYAVTTEVDIRLGIVSDNPEITLRNAKAVRQAVLSAPGDPSEEDWTIAARAQEQADSARRQLNRSTQGDGNALERSRLAGSLSQQPSKAGQISTESETVSAISPEETPILFSRV